MGCEYCIDNDTHLSAETLAGMHRNAIMSFITHQSKVMRGGLYMLVGFKAEEHHSLLQEPESELLWPGPGMMLSAFKRQGLPSQKMSVQMLASTLRSTLDELGIEGTMLELPKGVYVPNSTLDAISAWSDKQPLYEDVLPASEVTSMNCHDSMGPRRFAHIFDRIAQSKAVVR